jgi:PAT family beta-lactamase induction signal transducer AmpG
MENKKVTARNPWLWVPSLYFAQGVPYVVAQTVSVIMFKRLGISNTDIALYTSLLYLPWVVKPLWSPFVDMFSTKRIWIVSNQFVVGICLIGIAFVLPLASFFTWTIGILWILAFSSATHDIAADGYYMLALSHHHQAAFVGVRSTFFRLAMITGSGVLVMFAGKLEGTGGSTIALAWSITFGVIAGLFLLFFAYHRLMLPYPTVDRPTLTDATSSVWKEFVKTFAIFFKKKEIISILAFLLFYRFGEAQLMKMVTPFLLDARDKGGLGLSTSDVGIVYGTVGVICMTLGGLVGGYLVSRKGLKFWLWIMVFTFHIPDAIFVYLSHFQPENFLLINIAVGLEQFGYGFGWTAYMLYMIIVSEGEHKTAHYALCSGFMALGMMAPGALSGYLQELLGYKNFFLWVLVATIPGFFVTAYIKLDPLFGKKVEKAEG